MVAKKIMVWMLCLSSIFAQAQAPNQSGVIESADGRIEVLGQSYSGFAPVGQNQSRIVVYRLQDGRLSGATSIFVDGTYHASLIKGAYSELCYTPGNVELGSRQAQVGLRSRDLPDSITAIELRGGQTHYLRVREQGNRPVLYPVAAAQAQQELPGERLQMHTISRVAQECKEAPPEPARVQPGLYTIAADSLFAFARSDRQAMTHAGLAAVDLLVAQLRRDYVRLDRLHIIGHADPLGSRDINERLSIERASTVREYIRETGQLPVAITAEGRGSREPVTTDCPSVVTAQAKACNEPNRRVVIEVTGIRR